MGGRSISGAYGQVSCVSFPIDRYNEEERQAVGTLEPFVVEMMWDGKRREERVVIHPNPHPKLLLSNLLLRSPPPNGIKNGTPGPPQPIIL
jgi:hypothetical protein